jgi:hypothetical protein
MLDIVSTFQKVSTKSDQTQINQWVANANGSIALIGLKRMGLELSASPEPAILALAIVAFFLFLGHRFGDAWRVRVALATPQATVRDELRQHLRRQASHVFWACGLGVLTVLAVLFFARSQVLSMAEERLQLASEQARAAEEQLQDAERVNRRNELETLRGNYWRAIDERDHRMRRKDYATSISRMNVSILGLNVALVIVAAVAGYSRPPGCGDVGAKSRLNRKRRCSRAADGTCTQVAGNSC